jgi:hypothetical protein
MLLLESWLNDRMEAFARRSDSDEADLTRPESRTFLDQDRDSSPIFLSRRYRCHGIAPAAAASCDLAGRLEGVSEKNCRLRSLEDEAGRDLDSGADTATPAEL